MKILRSLTRQWQPKVTAISEKKSLLTLPLAALFGKLQEHELELSRLDEYEESSKSKGRNVALKTDQEKEDSQGSNSEDDEINLLTKKFSRFLRRTRGKKNFKGFQKKSDQSSKPQSSKIQCFECGKPGHIKTDCPELKKKMADTKNKKKGRKAYIAWEDNDSSSSSSSSEAEEQANICLMTKTEPEVSSNSFSQSNSSASSSCSSPNYDTLQDAFNELLEESIRIGRENNKLKSEVKFLLKKNTDLLKDLNEQKVQLECLDNLEIISKPCEQCSVLQKKVETLSSNLSKHAKTLDRNYENSSFVLESMIKSQRKYSNKQGLGYKPKTKHAASKTIFVKARNVPTCFYCQKVGHIHTKCFIKLYGVPNGRYMWVKKKSAHTTNPHGPCVTWVPH